MWIWPSGLLKSPFGIPGYQPRRDLSCFGQMRSCKMWQSQRVKHPSARDLATYLNFFCPTWWRMSIRVPFSLEPTMRACELIDHSAAKNVLRKSFCLAHAAHKTILLFCSLFMGKFGVKCFFSSANWNIYTWRMTGTDSRLLLDAHPGLKSQSVWFITTVGFILLMHQGSFKHI